MVGVDPINGEAGAPSNPSLSDASSSSSSSSGDAAPPPNTGQAIGFGDDTCPPGFTSTDVIENPSAQAGSCECGPCTATGAKCDATTFKTSGANNSQCSPGDGATLKTNGCFNLNAQWGYNYTSIVVAPPSSNGTCKADGQVVPAKIAKTTHRLCTGTGQLPPSFKSCSVTDGDVPCSGDKPTKHLVGTDVDATCAACTCTPTASCGGTMTTYDNDNCGGGTKTIGTTCTAVNQGFYSSYRMIPTVTQGCSDVTAAGPATVALKAPRTVCCPP